MIIFLAHQLGHTVDDGVAAAPTGSPPLLRDGRNWSEQWRTVMRSSVASLVALALAGSRNG